MTNHLDPSSQLSGVPTQLESEDSLRILSRSPYPYHHQNPASGKETTTKPYDARTPLPLSRSLLVPKNEKWDSLEGPQSLQLASSKAPELHNYTNSDSGTEADDEHFLKGLPAPRLRPHKGLRGSADAIGSATPSPIPSPALSVDESGRSMGVRRTRSSRSNGDRRDDTILLKKRARRKRYLELIRRGVEVALLIVIGVIVTSDDEVQILLLKWRRGTSGTRHVKKKQLTEFRVFIRAHHTHWTISSIPFENNLQKDKE